MLRKNYSLIVVLAAICGGCGSSSGSSGTKSSSSSPSSPNTEYAPSRFSYEPGTAGRAVGIHAVAKLAGEDVESHQLEIALIAAGEPTNSSTPGDSDRASSAPQSASQALCSTEIGQETTAFETLADRVCWIAYGSSGGAFGAGGSAWTNLFFTREGRYVAPAASMDVYIPPDLVNFSDVVSVGCLASAESQVSVDYLGSLRALGVSTSFTAAIPLGVVGSLSVGTGVGLTVYLEPNNNMAQAVQYDTTISGLAIGLIPFPISVRLQTMSSFLRQPFLVGKHADTCSPEGNPFEDDEPDVDASSSSLTVAALGGDPSAEFRAAADEFLAPLLDHLASETGFGPSEHMMAGSNADAFASLGGPGVSGAGTAPPSTFDDLLVSVESGVQAAADDQELAVALARNARDLGNIVPSPVLLDGLLRQAAVGIELVNESAAMRDSDAFAARELIRIDGMAGEEVTFTIEATEIASLLGVDESAVLGSTVKLSATHTLSDSEHVLEEPTLSLSFTPKNAVPLLVRVSVDLSTAQGPFDAALEGVEPQLAHRLIVPEAGAPAQLALSSAGRVAAGGAVTLNAVVADAAGNPVSERVEVELFDGEGASLGTATTVHGVASLQYVPEASEPAIDRVVITELTAGDETLPGISIQGSGFSVDAEIRIDGEAISKDDTVYSVTSAGEILVAVELAAGAKVEVENPGGAQSGEAVVEQE